MTIGAMRGPCGTSRHIFRQRSGISEALWASRNISVAPPTRPGLVVRPRMNGAIPLERPSSKSGRWDVATGCLYGAASSLIGNRYLLNQHGSEWQNGEHCPNAVKCRGMELDRKSEDLLLALDAIADNRGAVDLREFVPPSGWTPEAFTKLLYKWQDQQLVLLPSQKTLILYRGARNSAGEIRERRRKDLAPVANKLPDNDPEHFGPMPPVTLEDLPQTARGILLTMRGHDERKMDELRAGVGRPLPEVTENLQVLFDRKAARRVFGEDFKVKLTVFGQALANLAHKEVMDARYNDDSAPEPTQAPKEELSQAGMELRLLRAIHKASQDGEAVADIPLAEQCGIPPEKRMQISHALIRKGFTDPETMESVHVTTKGRKFLAKMNAPLSETDILSEALRRLLDGESRKRVLQQVAEVAKPVNSVSSEEIAEQLAAHDQRLCALQSLARVNRLSPAKEQEGKTAVAPLPSRTVPKEVVEQLHELMLKMQSGGTRLSACLVEGVRLASNLDDPSLRDFCTRELTNYSINEGDPRPDWRKISTYKLPPGVELNPQANHFSSEQAFLAEVERNLDVRLSPDHWDKSIGDTEEQLAEVDSRYKEKRGFAVCCRTVPAKLYFNDPKYHAAAVTVISPTSEIRNVISATRHEFMQRLLALEASVKAADEETDGDQRDWIAIVIDFLKEPWKAIVTLLTALLLGYAIYYVQHRWGINLQPPKP